MGESSYFLVSEAMYAATGWLGIWVMLFGQASQLMRFEVFGVIGIFGCIVSVRACILQFGSPLLAGGLGSGLVTFGHNPGRRSTARSKLPPPRDPIFAIRSLRGSMKLHWFLLAFIPGVLMAQTVQRVTVHGKALEGNLEGDSPDRAVMVYLPKSYPTERARRYPVLYLLHGFTDSIDNWWGVKQHFVSVPAAIEKELTSGGMREMIVVMPDAFTEVQQASSMLIPTRRPSAIGSDSSQVNWWRRSIAAIARSLPRKVVGLQGIPWVVTAPRGSV